MVLKEVVELESVQAEGELLEAESVEPGEQSLVSLSPLPAEVHSWVAQVQAVVEEALVRQEHRLAEREAVIRDQAEDLARMRQEVRHLVEMQTTRDELASETSRRVRATNKNLRNAIEERDRRLLTFARKVTSLRHENEDNSVRRMELLAELRTLGFFNGARRREIQTELESLV
jgi:hypothetical protein